jgi:membrane protein implicated in regulation of membrane protease activity
MSFEDLKAHDVFLPEVLWGKADLNSSVNRAALLAVGLLGIVACVLMLVGRGLLLTWLGAGLFILFVIAFALLSRRGIDRQNDRVSQLIQKTKKAADSD